MGTARGQANAPNASSGAAPRSDARFRALRARWGHRALTQRTAQRARTGARGSRPPAMGTSKSARTSRRAQRQLKWRRAAPTRASARSARDGGHRAPTQRAAQRAAYPPNGKEQQPRRLPCWRFPPIGPQRRGREHGPAPPGSIPGGPRDQPHRAASGRSNTRAQNATSTCEPHNPTRPGRLATPGSYSGRGTQVPATPPAAPG